MNENLKEFICTAFAVLTLTIVLLLAIAFLLFCLIVLSCAGLHMIFVENKVLHGIALIVTACFLFYKVVEEVE